MADDNVKLTLWDRAGNCNERVVELGSNLRKQLMEMGFSPYEDDKITNTHPEALY